jgi:tetratricopeptide (TPR) repeat protein
MIKKAIHSIALLLFAINIFATNSISDTSYTDGLTAFYWSPISDVEKVLQYENQKDIMKRTIDNVKKAKIHYLDAYKLMTNKEFNAAITEFKAAMKKYKRARLSNDALNFINANMALSYASTGNKEDMAVSKRLLELITPKGYTDNKWTYNIAIAHHKVGNDDEAASLLSLAIRKDKFYFQAYITLEAIYRNSGNIVSADKVLERMQSAEEKLIQKSLEKSTEGKKNNKKEEKTYIPKGKRPDVTNLIVVKTNDHLEFNKINQINERSMVQIQEGIGEYDLGIKALSNKDYATAQTHFKNTEKRLKRGQITEDGLNFTRGNLVISALASGEKRGIGQAKRYLTYLTPKLYKTREWTYNMAVAHYAFAKGNKSKTLKEEYLNKSVKLFKTSIKIDKLFLPAYENLIFVYREMNNKKKALQIYNDYDKARNKLMKSFSKQEQIANGGDPYIFRVNLGTFGEFDTPANLFSESYLITIPVSEKKTSYLAGMFYTLDEAVVYQKSMKKQGYTTSFIVAFKDGEKLEF